MKYEIPLLEGCLLKRYKRFLADIELMDGSLITAHCANPGAMTGLKQVGAPVWVSPVNNPKRKLQYDWHLIDVSGTGASKSPTAPNLVGVHTHWANKLAREALDNGVITELAGYDHIRAEVKYGTNSRVDFLLSSDGQPDCYVEVKSITLSRQKGMAEFPDSPSVRAQKHIGELQSVAQSGARAVMLYVIQRTDCQQFRLAEDIDPKYAQACNLAKSNGVETLAYGCEISTNSIQISHPVSVV